jgi:hypothetical protein
MQEDPELEQVERWLAANNVASSALGKHLAGDCAIISRWRKTRNKVTPKKREQILAFIKDNPNGIPGYTGGAKAKRRFAHARGQVRVGHAPTEYGPSQSLPVPALSECSDPEWIRRVAFQKGIPIAAFLAELVTLGIAVYRDTEAEELRTLQEQGNAKDNLY